MPDGISIGSVATSCSSRDLLRHLLSWASCHHRKLGDGPLGVLGLASTRFSSNQHSVVLLVLSHVGVGTLSNSPQVRGHPFLFFSKIDLSPFVVVEREALVGVDNNHEQTRVSVDHLSLVASLQIPEDRGIIK